MRVDGLDFTIRAVEPSDLDAWVALFNASAHWKICLDTVVFEDQFRPPDEPFLRLAAYTPAGELAGIAEGAIGEHGERWKDRAGGFVAVAPAHRRQGLGLRLLLEVERFAVAAGVRWLDGETGQRDLPAASALLMQRGYAELERYQSSRQEPATVDISGLEPLRESLRGQGIETATFDSLDTPERRLSLYRCAMAIQRDMPHEEHVDWIDAPPSTYLRYLLENPLGLRDGIFVASDGEEIVGLTYLVRRPGGSDAEVGDTGVRQTHRRRGIGRALKLMATRYAVERGFRYVYTDNRSDNVGMLAINRELGFVPDEVLVVFEKTLTADNGQKSMEIKSSGG